MKKYVMVLFNVIGRRQNLLLKIKLTLLALVLFFLQVSATVYSKATKFSFELKNKQIAEVLHKIEDNSNFRFFYEREKVDVEKVISINSKENTVEDILADIFKDEGIKYKILENDLILLTPNESDFSELLDAPQQKTVSGIVTEESGEPLPGVTVIVKGTTQGAVTAMDGSYSISNVPEDAIIPKVARISFALNLPVAVMVAFLTSLKFSHIAKSVIASPPNLTSISSP